MALTPETEAQILRYHHAERWPIGTIASQLHLHRDSVARVLAQAGLPVLTRVRRPSVIDPYLPFIRETLTQFPRLRASRLYAMVKDRGYPGRPDHFRHLIARHRPRQKTEVYLRLRTLPGEQMQVDWGHFGHIDVGRARRPLMAFVAVLSWSRQIFLHFYLGAHMENFLRGHVGAFDAWVSGPAGERRCPEDEALTVCEAFAQERERLLELPGNAFPTEEVRAVSAGKTPYVRFDLNDYSIPHTCVARTLTVAATIDQVRILEGQTLIATHPRSYDRRQQIEIPAHVATLVDHKHQASAHRGTDHLIQAVPTCRDLLTQAVERGEPLGRTVNTLTDLLAHYGVAELTAAIADALARGVPHPNAVRLALERRRQVKAAPPPLAVSLPDHVKRRDAPVRPHRLDDYDRLMENGHGD